MTVRKFFHAGIAVQDIDLAVDFFVRIFGFELTQNRIIEGQYLSDLIGEKGVSAQVRMLQMDDEVFLELLKWSNTNKVMEANKTARIELTEVGAQHICLYTEDAHRTYEALKAEDSVEFISSQVAEVTAGPNSGAKVFFVRVFDFLFLEVFQKPG